MQKTHKLIIGIGVCLAAFFGVYAQEQAVPVVSISYIEGTVQIQKPESEGWLKADTNSIVGIGEKLRTEDGSRAELGILGAKIRMDQLSAIRIYNPAAEDSIADSSAMMEFTVGDFWLNVSAAFNGDALAAVIKLKKGLANLQAAPETTGAIIRIGVGSDSTLELKVYSGSMIIDLQGIEAACDSANAGYYLGNDEAQVYLGQNSSKMILQAPNKLLITSRGKVTYLGPFAPADIDEQTTWVEWNRARDSL